MLKVKGRGTEDNGLIQRCSLKNTHKTHYKLYKASNSNRMMNNGRKVEIKYLEEERKGGKESMEEWSGGKERRWLSPLYTYITVIYF